MNRPFHQSYEILYVVHKSSLDPMLREVAGDALMRLRAHKFKGQTPYRAPMLSFMDKVVDRMEREFIKIDVDEEQAA